MLRNQQQGVNVPDQREWAARVWDEGQGSGWHLGGPLGRRGLNSLPSLRKKKKKKPRLIFSCRFKMSQDSWWFHHPDSEETWKSHLILFIILSPYAKHSASAQLKFLR